MNKRGQGFASGCTLLTLSGRMLSNDNNFAVGGYGIFKKLGREKLITITKQQRIYRKKPFCLLSSSSRPERVKRFFRSLRYLFFFTV